MKRRSKHPIMSRPLTAEQVRKTLKRVKQAKQHARTRTPSRIQRELLLLHDRISKVVKEMPPQEGFQFLVKSEIYTAQGGYDQTYFEILRRARSKKSK